MERFNRKQLEEESGVVIEGYRIKGDIITFANLTREDEEKVRLALETHIPAERIRRVTNEDIMNKLMGMENARN